MTRSDRAGCKARPVFLFVLVFLSVLSVADSQITMRKSHMKMQKLCSTRLSDALYIICRERGYNEPFSYSGEDEPRVDSGPGLVEECCYHQCSYEQLEGYCKPEKHAANKSSHVGNNLQYTKSGDQVSENLQLNKNGEIKHKIDDLKRGRHRGKGGRNIDGECKGKPDAKKRHRGRHCRCRRRRLECRRAGKMTNGDTKHLDNKFVTSSPTDKLTSFPSIS